MKSLVEFGVRKPVPVNLLMWALLIAGFVYGLTLRREFFPEMQPEQAFVSLAYPGATPEEIEETLARKVEDALVEVEQVDEIRTTLSENGGGIMIEFREGVDPREALRDVEQRIDTLRDLPDEAERITVELFEPRLPVIRLAVYGPLDEAQLKRAVRDVRDDLRSLPGMGEVIIDGVREYEVRVDVSHEAVLKLGIPLPDVAAAIRAWLRDIPGGTVRTSTGNVRLRTLGVEERAEAIRDIVVRSDPSGRTLRVGDIATVREGFVDEQILTRFNGEPAAHLTVVAVGNQDIVKMAERVRAYIRGRMGEPPEAGRFDWIFKRHRLDAYELGRHSPHPLPPTAKVAALSDLARFVEGRLDLLMRNAMAGAVLVFGVLLVFLNWRAAFWVGMGLVTAIAGTLVLMWFLDITLNLLTTFGLIIVLGLLVDDAIVVAENVQTEWENGQPALTAAVRGARQVLWPVVATVSTTVVAFLPLTFIKGQIGDLLGALPFVVACALLMSLVETMLILPSHLGHSLAKREGREPTRVGRWIKRAEAARDHWFHDHAVPAYAAVLDRCLRFRYVSIAAAVAAVTICLGLVASGRVVFDFLPASDAETLVVNLRMPIGSPMERTDEAIAIVEAAAKAMPEVRNISTQIGRATDIDTMQDAAYAPHVAQMFVELHPVELRDRESSAVIADIRAAIAGRVREADRISFSEISGGPGGADITIRASGGDLDELRRVSAELRRMLGLYEGVYDIHDDEDLGQIELRINVLPAGAALGFSTANIAQQVRGALYGIDAHVFADQEEDIDVRVRLDEATRRSLYAMENLWVVSPTGAIVPLREVARVAESQTYASIKRVDRRRTITVTAETDPTLSPETIVTSLTTPASGQAQSPLDELRARHPKVAISFAGRQEQLGDAFASLPYGFLASIIMIYVILAWLFSSYLQPIIVLSAVPFSIVGMVLGHLLLGYDLTFLSLIGFVALSGIVVNDSLILVEFYNGRRQQGLPVHDALLSAGRARLRAILLTTITTIFGLLPLILEQSFQAKFLIPMAITIAFGLMSATVLVLIVLPCFLLAFSDIRRLAYFLWWGETRSLQPMSRRITLPGD